MDGVIASEDQRGHSLSRGSRDNPPGPCVGLVSLGPRPVRRWRLAGEPPGASRALALTVLVLGLGLAVWQGYDSTFRPRLEVPDPHVNPFYGLSQINSWVLQIAPLYDARGQRLAHLVMLGALALLVLLAPRAHGGQATTSVWARAVPAAISLILAATALWFVTPRHALPLGVLMVAACSLVPRGRRRGLLDRLALVLTLSLLATITLPGLFGRLDLRVTDATSAYVQWHYSNVVGPSDLLASGWRLFADVQPFYGVLPSVLVAGYERLVAPIEMGGFIRLLQGLQLILVVACTWLYHQHGRRRWMWTFLALLLLVPRFHSTQLGFLFPNHTPWRMIAIPVACVTVMALRRLSAAAAALPLGAVAGASVLLNLECGIAIAAGLATYIFLRGDRTTRLSTALFRALLGGVAALAVGVVLCRLCLGYWPDPRALAAMLTILGLVADTSFSGLPLGLDPLALLMFGHAVFSLLVAARNGPGGFPPAFRGFVAATLAAWFVYYANRPHSASVSGFLVLYGFLAIDLGRGLATALIRRRANATTALAATAVAAILVPSTLATYAGAAAWIRGSSFAWRPPPGASVVSGIYLEQDWAAELEERAAALRSARPARVLYLTSDSYLLPKLSGVAPLLPFLDAVNAALSRPAYDALLSRISTMAPESVYYEQPGSLSDTRSPFRLFFDMMRRDLAAEYHRVGSASGWEIWRRIPTDGVELRGPAPEDGEWPRILAAGGRATESRETPAGRTWPDRLAARLRGRWPRAWVGNAGLDGQGTQGLLALLSRGPARLAPQLALFLVGGEDLGSVTPDAYGERLDLRAQPHLEYGPKLRRHDWMVGLLRQSTLPLYRSRLRQLIRAWRAIEVEPVLVTQPALFGGGVDPSTGVDLGTVLVQEDERINGDLAWELLELVNGATRKAGRESGVLVVDLAAGFPKDSRLFDDFLRFSEAGAEEVARRIAEALSPRLAGARRPEP